MPALFTGCGSSDSAPAATPHDAGAPTVVIPPKADSGAHAAVDAGAPSPFGHGAPSSVYPAPHPAAPMVENAASGDVMKAMTIVPVFFPNEQYQTELVDFVGTIGATDYWRAVTEEYGVGKATAAAPVVLAEAPAAAVTDDEIQAFITAHAGSDAAWGTPDANTLYVLFYPSTTKITLQDQQSCRTFGGYHSNTKLNGQNLAYAVIPRCKGFGAGQGLAAVTGPTSHELVEAATDPFPMTNAAFTSVSPADFAWVLALGGGEVSDLCIRTTAAFFTPDSFGYQVQRSWSNRAAALGHDPCVPAVSSGVYFNSAVVLPDEVLIDISGSSKAVEIKLGTSKTVEIDLFSDGPTDGPWNVGAVDVDALEGRGANLDFVFDRTSGVNGEKLNLTITANARGQYGVERFLVTSTLGNVRTNWAGMVSN